MPTSGLDLILSQKVKCRYLRDKAAVHWKKLFEEKLLFPLTEVVSTY
jgi:hypothetical protein